jgi:transposase InsO family protein
VVDHCTSECLGLHATARGNRFEALAPVHQAVTEIFGGVDEKIAADVLLRHGHGGVYASEDIQREIRFLGLESSPAFVGAPEGNGCAERIIRTLKEQLLWLSFFPAVAELNAALADFRGRYNHRWRLERHNYRGPSRGPCRLHGTRDRSLNRTTRLSGKSRALRSTVRHRAQGALWRLGSKLRSGVLGASGTLGMLGRREETRLG